MVWPRFFVNATKLCRNDYVPSHLKELRTRADRHLVPTGEHSSLLWMLSLLRLVAHTTLLVHRLSELIVFTMVVNTNDGIPSTLQEDLELFRRVMQP